MQPLIRKSQVDLVSRSRDDFYKVMVRKNYFLPSLKSQMVTLIWMRGVVENEYWCPKQDEFARSFQVAALPTKPELAQMLFDVVGLAVAEAPNMTPKLRKAINKTAELVLKRPPNKEWMMNIIGLLDSSNEIFASNYVPPAKQRAYPVFEEMLPNPDHFFNNLPPLTAKQMKHRALPMSKAARLEHKVNYMRFTQALQ